MLDRRSVERRAGRVLPAAVARCVGPRSSHSQRPALPHFNRKPADDQQRCREGEHRASFPVPLALARWPFLRLNAPPFIRVLLRPSVPPLIRAHCRLHPRLCRGTWRNAEALVATAAVFQHHWQISASTAVRRSACGSRMEERLYET
jgi:hypothetical protein